MLIVLLTNQKDYRHILFRPIPKESASKKIRGALRPVHRSFSVGGSPRVSFGKAKRRGCPLWLKKQCNL